MASCGAGGRLNWRSAYIWRQTARCWDTTPACSSGPSRCSGRDCLRIKTSTLHIKTSLPPHFYAFFYQCTSFQQQRWAFISYHRHFLTWFELWDLGLVVASHSDHAVCGGRRQTEIKRRGDFSSQRKVETRRTGISKNVRRPCRDVNRQEIGKVTCGMTVINEKDDFH